MYRISRLSCPPGVSGSGWRFSAALDDPADGGRGGDIPGDGEQVRDRAPLVVRKEGIESVPKDRWCYRPHMMGLVRCRAPS